jgi:hypothetical protein
VPRAKTEGVQASFRDSDQVRRELLFVTVNED